MVERVLTTTEVHTVERILNTTEVSQLTRVPVATLRWWRHQGTGPHSFKLGPRKVMYRESDVLAWIDEQYNAEQVTA
jgi:predicted DNA-binding transcriptional regulator AlpA